MREHKADTNELKQIIPTLKAGDRILLSGTIYTARDAAHIEMFKLLDAGLPLPFSLEAATIYYAGPTPTRPDGQIGSFGPTTSSRMDKFTPRLLDLGLAATIGKGDRSLEVYDSIIKNKAVYLCAIGGAGAIAARSITYCEEIALKHLGCESIKRLTIKDFPLILAIDSHGNSLFSN